MPLHQAVRPGMRVHRQYMGLPDVQARGHPRAEDVELLGERARAVGEGTEMKVTEGYR